MCIFFQFLPHISISMSLKSFSIYIVKFFELYISAVLLPIDYSYFFCCFVEIKKIPLWSLFLIVYLHLQWNAVLTQIMLCLAEAVLRNSRYFCMNPY